MTDEKNGPKDGPPEYEEERLTLEEFKRLAREAQDKGEPIQPLIRRLALSMIAEVRKDLRKKGQVE